MSTYKVRPTDLWETPPDFFAWLDGIFHFGLDVCATPENAKCPRYITEAQNGLKTPWRTRSVAYCNPPYSNVEPWLEKAYTEYIENGTASVVLTHSAFATAWALKYIPLCTELWLLTPRIQFKPGPGGAASSNARDSMMFLLDPEIGLRYPMKNWDRIKLEDWKHKPFRG